MQIQISTEHAIRIIRYLHLRERGVYSAQDISAALGVSYPFFVKIASMLRQAGILDAVQGRNGGYLLNKPASEISLYDVLLSIEGEAKPTGRRANEADGTDPCVVRAYFQMLQETTVAALSSKSVAEL